MFLCYKKLPNHKNAGSLIFEYLSYFWDTLYTDGKKDIEIDG